MYFGMLIPMTIESEMGITLPLFFAIGAGSLVLFFTLIIAFSIEKLGVYFKRITQIEKVMRYIAAILFILTGLYYVLIYLKVIE